MKKRKHCWYCARLGVTKTFRNNSSRREHIFETHLHESKRRTRPTREPGIPNVVHYGARMRKKLGLEYSPTGHLRSTLEVY